MLKVRLDASWPCFGIPNRKLNHLSPREKVHKAFCTRSKMCLMWLNPSKTWNSQRNIMTKCVQSMMRKDKKGSPHFLISGLESSSSASSYVSTCLTIASIMSVKKVGPRMLLRYQQVFSIILVSLSHARLLPEWSTDMPRALFFILQRGWWSIDS